MPYLSMYKNLNVQEVSDDDFTLTPCSAVKGKYYPWVQNVDATAPLPLFDDHDGNISLEDGEQKHPRSIKNRF